jgi:hypothetical protein
VSLRAQTSPSACRVENTELLEAMKTQCVYKRDSQIWIERSEKSWDEKAWNRQECSEKEKEESLKKTTDCLY